MENNRHILSPPPDVVSSSSAPPHLAHPPSPPGPAAEFLIVGLFALRLARRLIESLDYYSERNADVVWLTNFLAPFDQAYALAKISGPQRDDYVATYQNIIRRMKRQPKYPVRFMQMNPDSSMQQARRGSEAGEARVLTDPERLDIIDFCDAAGEWGSVVPIPAREAQRMIELADRRRIADLDSVQSRAGNLQELHTRRQLYSQRSPLERKGRQPAHQVRQSRLEDDYQLRDSRQPWRDGGYSVREDRRPASAVGRRRRVSFADEREFNEEQEQ